MKLLSIFYQNLGKQPGDLASQAHFALKHGLHIAISFLNQLAQDAFAAVLIAH